MRLKALFLAVSSLSALSGAVQAADHSGDGEPAFRDLYKELVETNTTLSAGSCTLAGSGS